MRSGGGATHLLLPFRSMSSSRASTGMGAGVEEGRLVGDGSGGCGWDAEAQGGKREAAAAAAAATAAATSLGSLASDGFQVGGSHLSAPRKTTY